MDGGYIHYNLNTDIKVRIFLGTQTGETLYILSMYFPNEFEPTYDIEEETVISDIRNPTVKGLVLDYILDDVMTAMSGETL